MTERRGDAVGCALFIATTFAVYPRLYFGFSFFDEAYYLALPLGFLAGHAPFVEERALPQLAGLLTLPPVALWTKALGSTEGLVLFARHVYFAATLGVAVTVARFFRKLVDARFAWAVAGLVVVYAPFCLFALSYNTLTLLGLWLACMALACAARSGHARTPSRAMGWATLALAIVSFSYPPMFFVALPAIGFGLWQVRGARGSDALRGALRGMWIAGGLVTVGLGGLLLALGFPGEFEELLAFSRSQAVQGGGLVKLRGMLRELSFQQNFLVLLASTLLLLLAPLSLRPPARFAVFVGLALGPAIAMVSTFQRDFHSPHTALPFVLTILGIASPWALFLAWKRWPQPWRRGVVAYTATSVAAGLVIWWATSNGLRNAALGFAPAAIIPLACLALPPRDEVEAEAEEPNVATTPSAVMLALASLLAFGVVDIWTHAYRERPPLELDTTMQSGPWRGIRTTAAANDFVVQLAADLETARRSEPGGADGIYFYDYFPAGYLLTDARPRASTLWTFPLGRIMQGTTPLREAYVAGLREQAALPGWVVRMKCIPSTPAVSLQYRESDPLPEFFDEQGFVTHLERPCYRIDRR